MKDKLKVYSIGIAAFLLASGLILFSIVSFKNGTFVGSILSIIIAIVVLVFAIAFLKREYKEVKKGFSIHDERSEDIMKKAGSKAYLISLYWILFIGWSSSNGWLYFEDISEATGIGVLGMAILFGLCWVYYNRK
ncbi:hypothetical protein HN865_00725 [Candidatus Woesearchaeota archaeon]|jgi:hypothetical protein|nr:hypothetical protein [Candidatus Woesearchaeota archaeon]MBT7237363.1 hypothetical protein [Candidatus Woesearchaeota archaeon]